MTEELEKIMKDKIGDRSSNIISHGYIEGFEDAVKTLWPVVEAAKLIGNESKGPLGLGEWEFRRILGNTNYECWKKRQLELFEALEKIGVK